MIAFVSLRRDSTRDRTLMRRKFYAALQLDDFTTRRLNCEAYRVGSKITSLHARQAVLSLLPRTQDAGTAVRNAAS